MADIIVASGPVIIENNKILLNRHGDDGLWKFPGGKVEWGEVGDSLDELEKACQREVGEEMGIEVNLVYPLKPMLIKRPDKPGTYVVLIHYLATRIGEIKPSLDILEWNWFSLDRLPGNCAPNIKPVLDDYRRISKK